MPRDNNNNHFKVSQDTPPSQDNDIVASSSLPNTTLLLFAGASLGREHPRPSKLHNPQRANEVIISNKCEISFGRVV